MKLITAPSPNHSSRDNVTVDTLVLHYTDMLTAEEAVARLQDEQAQVSAHYVIAEDGRIFSLVPEDRKAWHAGVSHWRGRDGVNGFSIGIELANTGLQYGYKPFPLQQMEALAELSQAILARHIIPARNVVGHSDIAPTRKHDPGELFDWRWLALQGIGAWVDAKPLVWDKHIIRLQKRLINYGYGFSENAEFSLPAVIKAFQQHFRPRICNTLWDDECEALLSTLLTDF